jgi:hypothetical protein
MPGNDFAIAAPVLGALALAATGVRNVANATAQTNRLESEQTCVRSNGPLR